MHSSDISAVALRVHHWIKQGVWLGERCPFPKGSNSKSSFSPCPGRSAVLWIDFSSPASAWKPLSDEGCFTGRVKHSLFMEGTWSDHPGNSSQLFELIQCFRSNCPHNFILKLFSIVSITFSHSAPFLKVNWWLLCLLENTTTEISVCSFFKETFQASW